MFERRKTSIFLLLYPIKLKVCYSEITSSSSSDFSI